MTTTIIRNGTFFDGTGAKGIKTDLIIKGGKIHEITPNAPTIEGAKEIDATNNWVMPGFLDIHTHYDAEVEVMPGLEESVRHGVTTVVFGNCSISAAIGNEEDIVDLFCRVENIPAQILTDWIKDKITWKTTAEYYEHLETLPVGPNIATLIGHSNLRIDAMGYRRALTVRKAEKAEIAKMKRTLEESLEAGYLGLSIDMLPFHRWGGAFKEEFKGVSVPSHQAPPKEYRQLANVVRRFERVLQATPNALDKTSVLNLLRMSSGLFRKNLKTTIVAALDLKSDRKIYKLATFLATFSNKILGADIRWQALSMPFLNYGEGPITPLFEEFPSMVAAIGASPEERFEMFGDPKFRKAFTKDWNHKATSVFPRKLNDMWVVDAPDKSLIGKSLQEIGENANADPLNHFMDLMREYDTKLEWKCVAANHRDKQRMQLLAHEATIPGFNDSGAHNVNMAYHDGALQTLRQAQNNPDIISIEKMIYRLTKLPADWLGIDAGSLEKGRRADVVVIDPNKLQTNLDPEPTRNYDPRLKGAMRLVKRSDGIVKNVLVNGEQVFGEKGGFHQNLGEQKFGQLLRALN